MASNLNLPATITNGTANDATQVMQDFNAIVSWINTNVTHLDASKAFTGIPSGPATDPTSANQFTRKAYVDALIPSGFITMYGGSTAPTGYLLCQGQAVSRATYAALFAIIGTTYGAGDGSTTFNLPNFQGKFPVGQLAADPDFGTLGQTGGSKSFTLSAANLPTHVHTINHDHASASTNTVADHTHGGSGSASFVYVPGSGTLWTMVTTSPTANDVRHAVATLTGLDGGHSHTLDLPNFTGNSGTGTGLTNSAVTAIQPYLTVNFIIKT